MKNSPITKLFIYTICLIAFFQINIFAYQTNVMPYNLQEIRPRPIGGLESEPDEKEYPAGANVVGSPATSGMKNSFSMGMGFSYVTLDNPVPSAHDIKSFSYSLSLTGGLTTRTDVSFSVPYSVIDLPGYKDLNGSGDLSVSLNHSYLKQEDFGFGLGFGLNANFPIGSDDIVSDENKTDFTGTIKLEKKLGNSALNFSFSYTYNDLEKADDVAVLGYGIALSHGFSDRFSASLELMTTDVRDENGDYTPILFLGTRFSLTDKAGMSLILGSNLENTSLKNIIVTSYSYSF